MTAVNLMFRTCRSLQTGLILLALGACSKEPAPPQTTPLAPAIAAPKAETAAAPTLSGHINAAGIASKYDATFELYVPLEEPGVHQLGMNPGNLMYDLTPHLALGAVGVWASQSNAPHSFGAGPSLKFRVPKGSITLDGVMGVTRWESEWRVSFFTQY